MPATAKKTLPRDRVGQLARWIHEAAMRSADKPLESNPWVKLSEKSQDRYRYIAWELLKKPPTALRDPLRASD